MTASGGPTLWPGRYRPLGATPDATGTNFAVWAPEASTVWLCLFDDAGAETRIALTEQTMGVWHGRAVGVGPGQRYGFRADGPWEPARGVVFHPDKLLLDPYARAIDGEVRDDAALAIRTAAGEPNPGDTAGCTPRGVVVAADDFDWEGDQRLDVRWSETVIYEAHVRGLTMTHPDLPDHLRGTFAGVAHPLVTGYLRDLGVTSVELLPVHQFATEPELARRGVVNYWGYNTVGYFAPHAGYASRGTRGEQVAEFKQMVKDLHAAGLEVILDVVYNHTAEGPVDGPTLSWRGLDDQGYYRTDGWGGYLDVTGCGNTVDASEPQTLRLIMDSLRYWAGEMHVDGFRFDLASALLRGPGGVDLRAPFLLAVHQDPLLREVKLIAEPWDATGEGYLVGQFPPPWCEWNDKFRDTTRDFWRGRSGGVRDLASRLAGSSDLYADDGRLPYASINFVTAHDGFTLRDLVSYDVKHNESNGEDNRDGADVNRSWNCGVEGETDNPEVVALRRRQAANLLATTLLATGVPMITAGDERGRTQRGNNNAFCHDSPLSWVSWEDDPDWTHLDGLARHLLALRAAHPVLRQRRFFEGKGDGDGAPKDITWLQPSGEEMTWSSWLDEDAETLGVFVAGDQLRAVDRHGVKPRDTSYLLWLHAGPDRVDVALPAGWADHYREVTRTDRLTAAEPAGTPPPDARLEPGSRICLAGRTLALFEAVAADEDVRSDPAR